VRRRDHAADEYIEDRYGQNFGASRPGRDQPAPR